MSTTQDICEAVGKFSDEELAAFRAWFAEFDAARWDRQFAEDVAAGRLDELAEEALRGQCEGLCIENSSRLTPPLSMSRRADPKGRTRGSLRDKSLGTEGHSTECRRWRSSGGRAGNCGSMTE
jgi:hypothetical protein